MDLNGDGNVDLISGSWPGELFFFEGKAAGEFAKPVMLQDKNGKYINIGGGIKNDRDGGITITGNADFVKEDGKDYAVYHGEKIESTAAKPVSITGTASAVHAVDWDADGDFDLLVGDIGGNLWLVPNEGTATKYAFGTHEQLKAGGQAIDIPGGDTGPFTADWDGDGDFDVLVGCGNGSVLWFRNDGKKGAPALAAPITLVPAGKTHYGKGAPKKPTRGTRAKVCATDWNGDGRLDLLVGDIATQAPDLPEPTAQEKAAQDAARAELAKFQKRYRKAINKLIGPNRTKDEAELAKVRDELKEVQGKMAALHKSIPPEAEDHGWVWLFLRKEARSAPARGQ